MFFYVGLRIPRLLGVPHLEVMPIVSFDFGVVRGLKYVFFLSVEVYTCPRG